MREVINLTRLRGAGSLGHEWAHALDHLIGQSAGLSCLATEGRIFDYVKSLKKVLNRIHYNENGIYTQYYVDSTQFDKQYSKDSHGYWSSECELFARAFACYLSDKLASEGKRNDYLNGHCNTYVSMDKKGNWIYAYPRGDERIRINEAIDELISELKDKRILFTRPEKKEETVSSVFTAAPNGQLCFA